MAHRKFYVVWIGHSPGIYDSWEECKAQIDGFPGARHKSFNSQTDATLAFRDNPDDMGLIRAIGRHKKEIINYSAFPEIRLDAIAVDAACAGNPGPMEYRGVDVGTGAELFHFGPVEDGTNNVGEFLALVHALALCKQQGWTMPIYSDSQTARAWVRNRKAKTSLKPTPRNGKLIELIQRAQRWLATNTYPNQILTWNTELWGEIPADFGRK
ncbi:MAG: ribonuclease H family protein [Muribaculum sp.]|nr:ribonuclease H family protein [Muribaculum sp.]